MTQRSVGRATSIRTSLPIEIVRPIQSFSMNPPVDSGTFDDEIRPEACDVEATLRGKFREPVERRRRDQMNWCTVEEGARRQLEFEGFVGLLEPVVIRPVTLAQADGGADADQPDVTAEPVGKPLVDVRVGRCSHSIRRET